MPPAPTRKSFHSSNLIHVLSDLALLDGCAQGAEFAEQLGLWLSLDDAIALHALHAAESTNRPPRSVSIEQFNLNDEFARLRARLETLDIPSGATGSPRTGRGKLPEQGSEPTDDEASYEPYRRYYLAHQRAMDMGIRSFRVKVRKALASTSPSLAKLAALDAVLDQALSEREQKLLSRVPTLLETRFKQLRQGHQQMLVGTPEADKPASGTNPGVWLARFRQEMQAVLLAELDARLEPTLGLIEAFNLEKTELHE